MVLCKGEKEGSDKMLRLLIADSSDVFASALKKQLQSQYLIKFCSDGNKALKAINTFEPDILLVDLRLAGADSLTIIRALQDSGRNTKVIAISGYVGEYALNVLASLGVTHVFAKPCDVASVICCIRDLGNSILSGSDWCLENEADRLLLSLGFRMGRIGYACCFDALCLKYTNFSWGTTKELYPEVAKMQGGNVKQVEKAIRDAIHVAWSTGNQSLWNLYFQPKGTESYCPTNDEFLSRMAKALMCGKRMRLPYVESEQ